MLILVSASILAGCAASPEPKVGFCTLVQEVAEYRSKRVRVEGVYVPNVPHRGYMKDAGSPGKLLPAAFPDGRGLETFFGDAYSGGGITTRMKVDVTVLVNERNGGVVLEMIQVHEYSDVSISRPPETAMRLVSLAGPISELPVVVRDGCVSSDPHGMSLVDCSQHDRSMPIFLVDDLTAVDGGALHLKSKIAFSETRQFLPVVLCGCLTVATTGDRWIDVEAYRVGSERVPMDSACD